MKVLITAGATWVAVDRVRILTNVFTGNTGLLLAEYFVGKGAEVTLILNPHCIKNSNSQITVRTYRYYHEFKKCLDEELSRDRYEGIIHTAAVSDYKVQNPERQKIKSKRNGISLRLVPLPKLIPLIRKKAPESYLVQCKLETQRKMLIEKAYRSLTQNKTDLVIANAFSDVQGRYLAYLIDKNKKVQKVTSRKALAFSLWRSIRRAQRGSNNDRRQGNYLQAPPS